MNTAAPPDRGRISTARLPSASGGGGGGDLIAAVDTPSQIAQARETYDQLRERLPEDRRLILELKVAGYSSKEIGDRLGISERTVQRALEELRNRARIED